MFTIRVVADDREHLPEMMLLAIRRRCESGALYRYIHIKDDVIREGTYGWEMLSYWGIPEEVAVRNETSLVEEAEEKLYSCGNLVALIAIMWDVLDKHTNLDIELFREDILEALHGPNVAKNFLCVLIAWSDRLGE